MKRGKEGKMGGRRELVWGEMKVVEGRGKEAQGRKEAEKERERDAELVNERCDCKGEEKGKVGKSKL